MKVGIDGQEFQIATDAVDRVRVCGCCRGSDNGMLDGWSEKQGNEGKGMPQDTLSTRLLVLYLCVYVS
jgi:hypothetical protein